MYYYLKIIRSTEVEASYDDISFPMYLPESTFRDNISSEGFHEPSLTKLMIEYLSEDDVFWDVGGARGYHSLLANTILESKHIHVFEPGRYRYEIIRYNKRKYELSWKMHRTFVSDENSDSAVTGERYAEEYENPDMVKIDIEGGEIEALKGMESVLVERSPVLFVEVHPGKRPETHDFVFDFLSELEYNISLIENFREPDWERIEIDSKEDLEDRDNYMLMAE